METQDMSFCTLGSSPTINDKRSKSGLEEWYDRVYELPFSRFSAEDFARSCRQNLFAEYIVPHVLNLLEEYPLAGELYEGELFYALTSLPMDFWKQNIPYGRSLMTVFNDTKGVLSDALEEDEFQQLKKFVSEVVQTAE